MRGKAEVRHERDQEPGITPACAGKRHCPRFRPGKTRDHPRVCGEEGLAGPLEQAGGGSPPRMRGRAGHGAMHGLELGITPAYAGKRIRWICHSKRLWDHPRVCGEEATMFRNISADKGSPPRMRGRGVRLLFMFVCFRITPAYAGKSSGNRR